MARFLQRLFSVLGILTLLAGSASAMVPAKPVLASSAAQPLAAPSSVTIASNFQSALGCPGDWQPGCAITNLAYDATDDVWQNSFNIPAGNDWEYKAALNGNWDVSYGLNGGNVILNLATGKSVKFYYDDKTHWVTDNVNSRIVTAAGDFQSKIGCPGDWQPDCLRSWMEDPDGDKVFTFSTTAIPAGNYQTKAAIGEGWGESYGDNGSNLAFSVPANNSTVLFTFNDTTKLLTVAVTPPVGHHHDNNVEWDGLSHDSRDPLYRTPGGAVPAGTPVTLRFRTFHEDVTGVTLRVYDINASAQRLVPMTLAAENVSCYQAGLEAEHCDFWEATLPNAAPDNLWYRFIVTDGSKTAYYADNTTALDGGLGQATADPVDNSWALMAYQPGFTTPDWAKGAVIYQIFPDRFRDGRASNNPKTGDPRYADPVLSLPWGTLPEGYCRNYFGATPESCPYRFGPPDPNQPREQPRGRDYMGGDLKGVDQNLDYLKSLGITTIYFNPIFDSASNHGYDTQNYLQIDPYFGTQKDWENLVKHANSLGIRIVLDGVFNHMSSDSPFFDRYHHYATVGACESNTSIYREWFVFHDVPAGTGTCVSSTGVANAATYDGWAGFDSIPVINKSLPAVQQYFLTASNSVSKTWLKQGSSGWRLDVMGDPSFPNGYWETFRGVVKTTKPDSLIISETWQKDSTLLRMLRGDRADTTMDYRFRDAVISLLAPQAFDSKGFGDSGHPIGPSQFAARILSIREDTPDAAYFTMMNLLDSHDTERLQWTLTPGADNGTDREQNAANVAAGKQRVKLASMIQFTMPGSPTIFYGDEVGITGDDDPDDRRTYPWTDLGGTIDQDMLAHYKTISGLHGSTPVLRMGDLRMLVADDTANVVAYGRKANDGAALVALNLSGSQQTVTIPVKGYLPNGTAFTAAYAVAGATGTNLTVTDGAVSVSLPPMSGILLTAQGSFTPPVAPSGLKVTNEGNAQIALEWTASAGAAGYNVYRSPVSGGGYVLANSSPLTATTFTDIGLTNAQSYYYVVKALDSAGNESGPSNEASGMPHLVIGWANTQWPPTLTQIISVVQATDNVYGQVWIDGVTSQPGATPTLRAQLGFGPAGSKPAGNSAWTWVDAGFNVDTNNNDEFKATLLPDTVGTFDYLYRYTTTNGRDWLYADLNGPVPDGQTPPNPGILTVNPSADITPPAAPANLKVTGSSPSAIELAWDAVTGDSTLYGYEVLRSDKTGGSYSMVARVTTNSYTDTSVAEGAVYFYVVRAVDLSFNRSGDSNEVQATAEPRNVNITFNVTVPTTTDATGRVVNIAGTLAIIGLSDWNPGGQPLTRMDATHWTITLSGVEGTQLQYKYALGDWDHVEKDGSCGEIGNRTVTLAYGSNGAQTVNDTVQNWRNVAPCGN